MKRILLVVAGMFAVVAMASAKMVFMTHHPCLDGGSGSYTAGYIDDRTGMSYMITRDCYGNTCVYPLYGPFQPRVASQNEWRLPKNFDELVENASEIEQPGAYVGIWVTDVVSGDILKFRNPVDEAERLRYLQMWMENENSGSSTFAPEKQGSRFLEDIYREDLANQSTEERIKGELIDHYWKNRFGENGWPASDEMQSVTNACALMARNGSSIVVKQSPSPANGGTLVIAPLLPELSSPAAIYNTSGQVVWSGQLDRETSVPLDNLPSGLYLVRAIGKDVPLSLVR